MSLSEDDKHDFIAALTTYLLGEIKRGNEIFVVLGFRHDNERGTMCVTSASVQAAKTDMADKMAVTAEEIVHNFMNTHYSKWAQ